MIKYYFRNILLVSFLLIASMALAADLSPEKEKTAKELEIELISPCCFTQPLSDHPSGASDRMKIEIREMLAAGRTKQQILDHYVAIHGAKVLSIPPQKGFNRMAFLMPVILVILGAVIAVFLLKKWRKNQRDEFVADESAAALKNNDGLDSELAQRLEQELKNM